MPAAGWVGDLERDAPDVIACWRSLDAASPLRALRRELRARVALGSAPRILAQQESVGNALEAVLARLSERLLRAPGGEEDWNAAQAFAHATAGRRFLATWASLDAGAAWPEDRPPVVTPSVPGPADASPEQLLILLDKSRRAIREAATRIEGHETQRCRLEHPLIGRLRCGDWLLWIGVHDCMHLEQLHRLIDAEASAAAAANA